MPDEPRRRRSPELVVMTEPGAGRARRSADPRGAGAPAAPTASRRRRRRRPSTGILSAAGERAAGDRCGASRRDVVDGRSSHQAESGAGTRPPDLSTFFNVVAATDSAPPAGVELDDAGRGSCAGTRRSSGACDRAARR